MEEMEKQVLKRAKFNLCQEETSYGKWISIILSHAVTLMKVKRSGGHLVSIEDQRIWVNIVAFRHRIMQENERRSWRKGRGLKHI